MRETVWRKWKRSLRREPPDPISVEDGFSGAVRSPPQESTHPLQKYRVYAIFGIGLLGLLLLSLPGCESGKTTPTSVVVSDSIDPASYAEQWKRQTVEIVTAITGDPEPTVVVTLAQSREYVYEYETDRSIDGERNSEERTIARYEDSSGRDQALVRTTLEPKAAGVVVVCQNGDQIPVRSRVIQAVSTALGLSSDKVYVTERTTGGAYPR